MWIMKYCGMFDIVTNVWISWKTKQIMFGVHIHWQWMIIYCSLKFMCIKILHNFFSNMYAKINTRFISHFLVFRYTSINFCLHMLLPPSPHTYIEFCVGGSRMSLTNLHMELLLSCSLLILYKYCSSIYSIEHNISMLRFVIISKYCLYFCGAVCCADLILKLFNYLPHVVLKLYCYLFVFKLSIWNEIFL